MGMVGLSITDVLLEKNFPRLLDIKRKVDMGGKLDEADIRFLSQITHCSQKSKLLEIPSPKWKIFYTDVFRIYKEIVNKALDNVEKAG